MVTKKRVLIVAAGTAVAYAGALVIELIVDMAVVPKQTPANFWKRG